MGVFMVTEIASYAQNNVIKKKNKYCDLRASTGAFYFEKVFAFKRDLKTRRF